jgi:hypothetical protein
MQNTGNDQYGKKLKILEINFFDFSIMDIDETKVGEVEGRLQRGFGIGFNDFTNCCRLSMDIIIHKHIKMHIFSPPPPPLLVHRSWALSYLVDAIFFSLTFRRQVR